MHVRRGARRLHKHLSVRLTRLARPEPSVLIKFPLVVELSAMFVLLGMISKNFIFLSLFETTAPLRERTPRGVVETRVNA